MLWRDINGNRQCHSQRDGEHPDGHSGHEIGHQILLAVVAQAATQRGRERKARCWTRGLRLGVHTLIPGTGQYFLKLASGNDQTF